jgi:hypothetical protein
VKVNVRFGEEYRLHLLGLKVRQTRKQHEAGSEDRFLRAACFTLGYFLTYFSTLKV